jgi:flagellar biosynthesis/type III secretory pathway M-ring protein FliF/YscJ
MTWWRGKISFRPQTVMAQRKRNKRGWLRTALFYLLFPLIIWLVALLIWFYWYDLTRIFTKAADKPKDAVKREGKIEPREKIDSNKPEQVQEKILDEERRKLEDILKQRQ